MPKYQVDYGMDIPAYGSVEIEADDKHQLVQKIKALYDEDQLIDGWNTMPELGTDNHRIVRVEKLYPDPAVDGKDMNIQFDLNEYTYYETPKFAQVSWSPADVQTYKPDWTEEQCREWLAKNAKYIQDRLCEVGNEVIETLLPIGESED